MEYTAQQPIAHEQRASIFDWILRPVVWAPALGLAVIVLFLVLPNLKRAAPYDHLVLFELHPYTGQTLRGGNSQADYEFQTGIQAYEGKKLDEAIPHLKKAAELDPSNTHAWLYLGIAQFMKRDADAAVQSLGTAVNLADGEDLAHARWYLAQTSLLKGDAVKAKEVLNQLVAASGPYQAKAVDLLKKIESQ